MGSLSRELGRTISHLVNSSDSGQGLGTAITARTPTKVKKQYKANLRQRLHLCMRSCISSTGGRIFFLRHFFTLFPSSSSTVTLSKQSSLVGIHSSTRCLSRTRTNLIFNLVVYQQLFCGGSSTDRAAAFSETSKDHADTSGPSNDHVGCLRMSIALWGG